MAYQTSLVDHASCMAPPNWSDMPLKRMVRNLARTCRANWPRDQETRGQMSRLICRRNVPKMTRLPYPTRPNGHDIAVISGQGLDITGCHSLQCRRILASEVASERILIKRAPSWIQTRKRLGERRKCVLGSEFTIASSKTPALQAKDVRTVDTASDWLISNLGTVKLYIKLCYAFR